MQPVNSAPPPPTLLVGREDDLRNLRALLTKQSAISAKPPVVNLLGSSVKAARSSRGLTQETLAERAGYSLRLIKKAEAGLSVWRQTALDIAASLNLQLDDLVDLSDGATPTQVIVTMRGLPGVGKTTLSEALANDSALRRAFPDGLLWTSLGQSPDLMLKLTEWSRLLNVNLSGLMIEDAQRHLAAALRDKRVLLIVDDAWEVESAEMLMLGGRYCSALVTTRVTAVANAITPVEQDVYILKVLSDDHGLEVLDSIAHTVVAAHRPDCLRVVQALEGLPLALQVAGHLLREEAASFDVTDLLRELQEAGNVLDAKVTALLRKSSSTLDHRARLCFAYLGWFDHKPATFVMAALEAVWEPLSHHKHDLPFAKNMVKLLVARGLLEPKGEGRFWLHAVLVAHAASLLEEMGASSDEASR